ncbi:NADP-dependent phosphogluconate dehydrogenase [Winogradskyella sp. A2]|uniref:NADP-dependent phosphogluconate dehydrogenase n=1 Tax=Winogradskyella sp. A2 TaxID=3366944 RepID=UPI00398C5647
MERSVFGIIGLGVMGRSLSLNIADKGFKLSVYNRNIQVEETIVSDFLNKVDSEMEVLGFTDLVEFVSSLERPRKILIMIKAGNAIDGLISQLLPLLSEGDIIIDGGNSFFLDTNKRELELKNKGIKFLGCGVSGGEKGALNGPSLMVGGHKRAYEFVSTVLEAIAGKDKNGNPCCTLVGKGGSGHFVKMIHNGIEYVEMQLLAEIYSLLTNEYSSEEISSILSQWNQTDLTSYLLGITSEILSKKEKGKYIIDTILDKAGNKGTGSWSSKIAFDLGSVNTMMSSAVFARYISSLKSKRAKLSNQITARNSKEKIDLNHLENAYRFARIINHHQGFELIKKGSDTYNWNLDLSEIARIWTNGCIIRSEFMEQSILLLSNDKGYLDDASIISFLKENESSIIECLDNGLKNRLSLNTFYTAYDYWVAITTERLPANLIQAQRDYFGAHTYQKIGFSENELFHTNWEQI